MSQGKRPGGLTALAVINFVFGGFMCLGILGITAAISLAKASAEAYNETVASNGSNAVIEMPSLTGLYIYLLLFAIATALIITSGIGYLGLKKTMGFKLGNLYAIVSILASITGIVVVSGSFGLSSVIGFIYPLVTLFLLNTTFKEDFVN